MKDTFTQGKHTWQFACDSYGKVRHSRKACVFTTIDGDNGERIVTIAARIPNWADAALIAAAPDLLTAARHALEYIEHNKACIIQSQTEATEYESAIKPLAKAINDATVAPCDAD